MSAVPASSLRGGALPRVVGALAGAALAAALVLVAPATTPVALAEEPALPGMCNGRTDVSTVINAQAHGDVKYVLNVSSDATGAITGVLVLGQGADRLYVDQFCRVWQHLPGQPYGDCSADLDEAAATAHAVGVGRLPDGTRVVVRTDVRQTEEGAFFRVRHRVLGAHDHEVVALAHEDDGGCEDDSWVRTPTEGWAPLHRLGIRQETG